MSDNVHTSDELVNSISQALGSKIVDVHVARGEVTLTVGSSDYVEVMQQLHSGRELAFDQLIDLCGVDYSTYEGKFSAPARYAVVVHLLSVALNRRLRVKVFAEDDDFPRVQSVTSIWASASWFEREAFDLYGVVFDGHSDLRRILTDYGFIGHPFRKDFPLSGYVEMRYDADRRRVVYEPVTIEPRENTPRVVREDNYGGLH
jgi:NADH-quinone oxidoreductase subunit C